MYNIKTIEQITATLAHEVKNPVALIKANIEYMQLNDATGLYEKNYSIIKKELDKISYIIMDFMKLVKPSRESDKELIFIYDAVIEIVEEFNMPAEGKIINFQIYCPNKDLKIYGVYSKISIMLFNIIKNASEAIHENGNISISIQNENDFVIIKISDDGEGISDDIKDKIGTPFLTTKEAGSGLGIPICKSVAEEHHGIFEISNNEKSGCTVYVKIPVYIN